MATNYISKIQLPGGGSYFVKDTEAREMIAGGIKFVIAWGGKGEPVLADIPAGVKVKYGEKEYTGTLAASKDTLAKFYLVANPLYTPAGTKNIYLEYVTITSGEGTSATYSWEKLGDTQVDISNLGQLAYQNSIQMKADKDNVLGEATTFTAAASNVSFSGTSQDNALGEATTFSGAFSDGVNVTAYLDAAPAISSSTTYDAIVGFGDHSKKNVLGEDATFKSTVTPTSAYIHAETNVTIDATSKDSAMGADATFSTRATVEKAKMKATASGGAFSYTDADFIQGYAGSKQHMVLGTAHDTPTLNTKYLERKQVLTSAAAEISKMVKGNANNILVQKDNAATIKQVSYTDAVASKASGANATWSFTVTENVVGSYDFTLNIGGANDTWSFSNVNASYVQQATDITTADLFNTDSFSYATGALAADGTGASVAYNVTIGEQAYVATGALVDTADGAAVGISLTAGTQFSYATGELGDNASGAEVMIGLGEATKAKALVSGSVSAISVALSNDGTGAAGEVEFAYNVNNFVTSVDEAKAFYALKSGATATAYTWLSNPDAKGDHDAVALGSVSVATVTDSTDSAAAITALGAAQTQKVLADFDLSTPGVVVLNGNNVLNTSSTVAITAGKNDLVNAYIGLGTATAAAQAISVGENDRLEVLLGTSYAYAVK